MSKPRIKSFDFIKSLCAIGIIVFHFSCFLPENTFRPFLSFSNGAWGSAIVTTFFIVSGALLYYNYSDSQLSLRTFYSKRWLSIFPMYYIAYGYFELSRILTQGMRSNPLIYIFTLFGMDGYLSSSIHTYYILGEWFLGMIVILYLLFPLVLFFFQRNSWAVIGFALLAYLLCLGRPIINTQPFWSITSCLVSFVAGMFLLKYQKHLLNKYTATFSAVICLLIIKIKLNIPSDIGNHLVGLFLFISLFVFGEWLMKNSNVSFIVFSELSRISYPIFLLQNITIQKVLGSRTPASPIGRAILLLLTILMIVIQAEVLSLVTDTIVKKLKAFKT